MPSIENHLAARRPRAKTLFALALIPLILPPAIGYAAEETATRKPAKDPKEVICKNEKITGSYMKKRVCLPREVWDEVRRMSQNQAAEAMRGGISTNPQ